MKTILKMKKIFLKVTFFNLLYLAKKKRNKMKVKKNAYQGLILDPDDPGYKRGWTIRLAPKLKRSKFNNKKINKEG